MSAPLACKCVFCGDWCEKAPTKDGWIRLDGHHAIHYRCLEHLWETYQFLLKSRKETDVKNDTP